MGTDDDKPRLNVSVAFSPRAGEVDEIALQLDAGATAMDAVKASGLQERYPEMNLSALPIGVWGSFCEPGTLLRDRDRVELYRPLKVDPKEARRLRYRAAAAESKRKRAP